MGEIENVSEIPEVTRGRDMKTRTLPDRVLPLRAAHTVDPDRACHCAPIVRARVSRACSECVRAELVYAVNDPIRHAEIRVRLMGDALERALAELSDAPLTGEGRTVAYVEAEIRRTMCTLRIVALGSRGDRRARSTLDLFLGNLARDVTTVLRHMSAVGEGDLRDRQRTLAKIAAELDHT